MNLEDFVDIFHVVFDGINGNKRFFGNHFVAFSFHDAFQNFLLSLVEERY